MHDRKNDHSGFTPPAPDFAPKNDNGSDDSDSAGGEKQ